MDSSHTAWGGPVDYQSTAAAMPQNPGRAGFGAGLASRAGTQSAKALLPYFINLSNSYKNHWRLKQIRAVVRCRNRGFQGAVGLPGNNCLLFALALFAC